MNDYEYLKIISKKTGYELVESNKAIPSKITYFWDENEQNILRLSLVACNMTNETLPEELWKFKALELLDLRLNMISNFPMGLIELKTLKELDLSTNQIRVISSEIKHMESLEKLDLSDNQLETLPQDIGKLRNLKRLRLISNRIIKLPSIDTEKEWLAMENLQIDGADVKELPSWLFTLKSLKILSLSKLHLNRFPESIIHLKKLEHLYLDGTQFPKWPDKIDIPSSVKLIVLDGAYLPKVENTDICQIPDFIVKLKPKYVPNQQSINKNSSNLQVSLGGNISNGLNEEKLFNDNVDISYQYLQKIYKNKSINMLDSLTRIKDVKIVLLGAGAVGKTSLVQRLCLTNPDNDNIPLDSVQTTHGVNIDYTLNLNSIWDNAKQRAWDFIAHFWDFGGQNKYRGINKFLLTDNAIYIIVTDSRTDSKPDIWLEMIKQYAPKSTVILVANKIDENERLNLNFKYYCEQFTQLYNCMFKISCKYPKQGINKISEIVDTIKKIITNKIDAICPIYPITWCNVQLAIERKYRLERKAILNQNEYIEICKQNQINNENEQEELLNILNTCGTCISFDNDYYSILNPDWIANYLYIFYNNMSVKKAFLDYRKEYLPMIEKMVEYSQYIEPITTILGELGLCLFFQERVEGKNIKKVFCPMFLPEQCSYQSTIDLDTPILEYYYRAPITPELEFQKFLIDVFTESPESLCNIWQFGANIKYNNSEILLELIDNNIRLKIWANDEEQCRISFQWIRDLLLKTAKRNFFDEYIKIVDNDRNAIIPLKTLQTLNEFTNINIYFFPERDFPENLICCQIQLYAKKCGLPLRSSMNRALSEMNLCSKEGKSIVINIENMYGNITDQSISTGDNSTVNVRNNNDIEEKILQLQELIKQSDNSSELKEILKELQRNTNEKTKKSCAKKLREWLSMASDIATVSPVLLQGIQTLLQMIS